MHDRRTILVVDDDQTVRDALVLNLSTGYDVLVAKDGLDAVHVYECHAACVAAIVTDLNMPRLCGQSLTQWLHHINPRLPVVVISGSARDEALDAFLRRPCVHFLPKPFESSRLQDLLGRLLAGKLNEAEALSTPI